MIGSYKPNHENASIVLVQTNRGWRLRKREIEHYAKCINRKWETALGDGSFNTILHSSGVKG